MFIEKYIKEAVQNYKTYSPLEVVLLDVRGEDGDILTILRYDEEHVIIQYMNVKGDLKYKIVQNEIFCRYAN